MSIVEASAGTYRSRVDGTLVLSVEIEPRFVAAALELFRTPGTPLAIAALKVNAGGDDGANRGGMSKGAPEPPAPINDGAPVPHRVSLGSEGSARTPAAPSPEPEPKGGVMAQLAGRLCKEPEFQKWIARKTPGVQPSEEAAAGFVRLLCGVKSRAEIDTNPEAERKFHEGIRGPWLKQQGLAARGK